MPKELEEHLKKIAKAKEMIRLLKNEGKSFNYAHHFKILELTQAFEPLLNEPNTLCHKN